jgi:hypothetical protein
MNEFPMNLTTDRIDHGYLKVLIVDEAILVPVLCQNSAMGDRFCICLEVDSDSIPERNAVFQIEEKFLHNRQPWFVLFASRFLFLNDTRSEPAICRS